jgi:hypothetical protein
VGLGVGVGVLGGAILGSQYPYDNSGAGYYDYPQYEVGVDPSYCANTYRSYDPSSGTYLGYDGYRHPCP